MNNGQRDVWASDTPVSRPEAIDPAQPALVDLGGFAMTSGGITHNLSNADLEAIFLPTFAPEGYRG